MSSSSRAVRPEQIRPLRNVVEYEETAAFALHLMDEDGIDSIPVVSPGVGNLLGMVYRAELEERCLGFHDPARCLVRNHLRGDVPYCFDAEPLDGQLLQRGVHEPVVVVDRHRRPLGFLQSGAPAGILVVAADARFRELVARLLRLEGYRVRTVRHGSEAVTVATEWGPDLVLLDLAMPALDDWHARPLPVSGNGTEMHVLVVAGPSELRDRDAVRTEGFVHQIRKPFTPDDLLAAVANVLARAPSRAQGTS